MPGATDDERKAVRAKFRATGRQAGRYVGFFPTIRELLRHGLPEPPAPPAEREPWPPPLVPCTEVPVDHPDVPRAARQMAVRAVKAGWDVRVTLAVGTWSLATKRERPDLPPTPTGKVAHSMDGPPHIAVTYAVRCKKASSLVAAMWLDGKYESGVVVLNGVYDYRKSGSTDVNGALQHG